LAGELNITPAAPAQQVDQQRLTAAPSAATATAQSTGSASATGASSTGTSSSGTAASAAPLLNPSLHLDPSLNIVVLEFFDSKGNVTQSIPSQRQLDAYKLDGGTTDGQSSQSPVSALL
jgi:hypothetical protein